MDLRINGRYRIGRRVGTGSIGDLYAGTDLVTSEPVAIKLESTRVRSPQLFLESHLHSLLRTDEPTCGIPRVHWQGVEGDYNVVVLDLLGPTLEDLFSFCGRRFSVKTVLMLTDQILSRVSAIHEKGFVHRDIKPDNLLMGCGRKGHLLHLIDYGLAKKYVQGGKHVKFQKGKSVSGTARYASISSHRGWEQSRRDDLESIAYILLYFLRGSLPWQSLKASSKFDKYSMICEKKVALNPDVLCRDLPNEFCVFLQYARALGFEEEPEYGYLKNLFRALFCRLGFSLDFCYDWVAKRIQMHFQRGTASALIRSTSSASAPSDALGGHYDGFDEDTRGMKSGSPDDEEPRNPLEPAGRRVLGMSGSLGTMADSLSSSGVNDGSSP